MLNREIVNALMEIGYSPISNEVFRANWSSAKLDHILLIRVAKSTGILTAYFGARNIEIERFSWNCLTTFNFPNSPQIPFQGDESLLVRFRVGRKTEKASGWELALISTVTQTEREVCRELIELVQSSTLGMRQIRTFLELNAILVSDDDVFSWIGTNPITRTAQIVGLSKLSGLSDELIRESIRPHFQKIGTQLRGAAPQDYLNYVFSEWERLGREISETVGVSVQEQ